MRWRWVVDGMLCVLYVMEVMLCVLLCVLEDVEDTSVGWNCCRACAVYLSVCWRPWTTYAICWSCWSFCSMCFSCCRGALCAALYVGGRWRAYAMCKDLAAKTNRNLHPAHLALTLFDAAFTNIHPKRR